jgi:hypothetical protein
MKAAIIIKQSFQIFSISVSTELAGLSLLLNGYFPDNVIAIVCKINIPGSINC